MLNREKHRHLLFKILKEIFESSLGKSLAFKGGTACYFFHGLGRFSTDLDFDLLDDDVAVDRTLEGILRKYGKLKKGRKMVLSYGGDEVNIKVDVSRKIWKSNCYEIRNFYGTDIRVQDKGTLFANKLVALTERSANRDIYDVWFFLSEGFEIHEDLVQERTGMMYSDFVTQVIQYLKKLPKNYNILDGLGEVLNERQKLFVKKTLISELIGMLEFKNDRS